MKKYVFIILALSLTVYLTGCGQKKEAMEESQEPLSIEVSPGAIVSGAQMPDASLTAPETVKTAELPLPPQGPYKPTNQEIQTALKNAGFYTGEIDGKIGPLSKKAIKEFQVANNLQADGKVGQKTWAVLSQYLNPLPVEPVAKKR